jgi:uncharacterized protein (UPF0261 family)
VTDGILLVGTVDTKGAELAYLRDEVLRAGGRPLVMDVGVLGAPAFAPDVAREEVAAAAGTTIAELVAGGDENVALQAMARGAARLAARLQRDGRIGGALAIGGTMGTDLALDVMAALPLGVPKLVVSSVAHSHLIPPERVSADLTMMLWAGGLWGLNTACRAVLRQAAGAAVGAARAAAGGVDWSRPAVGVSSLGSACCRYLGALEPALAARGYDVVVFHATGPGGRALEALVAEGRLAAVLDLCLIEVSDHELGSVVSAGDSRLETAGRLGVPQIVAPAGVDAVDFATWRPLPPGLAGRPAHAHNRLISVAKTTAAEKEQVARALARKLNAARGPVALVMPLGGVDEWDRPGQPMHDPEGLAAMARVLEAELASHVDYRPLAAHVNDPDFAELVLALFDGLVAAGAVPPGRAPEAARA